MPPDEEQSERRQARYEGTKQACDRTPIDEGPGGEEHPVDGSQSEHPAEQRHRQRIRRGREPPAAADAAPARPRRPYLFIEGHERRFAGRRREERDRDPDYRRGADRDQQRGRRVDAVAAAVGDEEPERHDERAEHRADLAPGVYPPPEPAQEVNETGARANREQQRERVLGVVEEE